MEEQPVILIAEDDAPIRSMMSEVLADEGYTVIACRSGEQAIRTLARAAPSLLLTDLHMEEAAAGLRVVRHLRSGPRARHIPAIIYSADSAALRESAGGELEGVVTVGKPFDVAALLDTISELLGRRAA